MAQLADGVKAAEASAQEKAQRFFQYDFVRAVAIVFVVAVHSLAVVRCGSLGGHYVTLGQSLFFSGNALFFLLSGRFNLKERQTDLALARYYLSKIRNIMIPLAIVFTIRTLYQMVPHWEGFVSFFVELCKNCSFQFSSNEYWFVFSLVGYLLVTPFLAKGINGLSRFAMKVFFWIGIGYNSLCLGALLCGFSFSWGYMFSGFAFAFMMGRIIEDFFADGKWKKVIIALIPVMLAATFLIATYLHSIGDYSTSPVYSTSPFHMMLGFGLFLLLVSIGAKVKKSRAVSFVAKHSFSIYLIHMMIMPWVLSLFESYDGYITILLHPVVTIMVLCLSLVLSVVLDRVLINPAKHCFDVVAPKGK